LPRRLSRHADGSPKTTRAPGRPRLSTGESNEGPEAPDRNSAATLAGADDDSVFGLFIEGGHL
jgi:hypothetical protein